MLRWLRGTFAALDIRSFRILFGGTLFSFVAFFMSTVVNSVVAFEIEGTNRAVGFVVFGQGAAMALLGPLGGAYADRWPRRRVAVTGQLVAAGVFTWLAILLWRDAMRIVFLSISAFMIGATFAFLGPARQGLVVDLVPPERRGNAMAISNIANTASRVVGPAIAGVLLSWKAAGATGAYAVMALFYLISAVSMALLPRSVVRSSAGAQHVLADILDGWRYVWSEPRLRRLVLLFMLVILTGLPHVTVLPGLLENELGRDSEDISYLMLFSAVGALIASIGVAAFADSRRAAAIYTALALAFGGSLLGAAVAPGWYVLLLTMFLIGAASGGFQALNGAVIARAAEPAYIGRVISLTLLAFGGFGLMALPFGWIADSIGERGALGIMGLGVALWAVALGVRLWRSASTDSERAAASPDQVS